MLASVALAAVLKPEKVLFCLKIKNTRSSVTKTFQKSARFFKYLKNFY